MRVLCLVLLFLVVFSSLGSAETTSHWLEVKTDHFTVLTDGSERQARHTAGQLERMHNVFARLLPNAADDPGSRIVVLAFRDRRGFQAVEPEAYLAKNALDLTGLFIPRRDRSYILLRLDTSGDHPYATVYHEYTHYMNRRADYLPVWLNEGLAQFYQNTDILDRDVRLGQPDAAQILFLRNQRLLPLETLFRVDHNSPYYHEEDKGNIFYAESWALTHLLFMADFGKPNTRLHAYTLNLAHGESSLEAAQHAFGNLKLLQAQLEDYIRNGSYRMLAMPLQNVVDEKDLTVDSLSLADADATRADVLAQNGRVDEAKTLIQAVLAQDPQNAQAHESMGTIELRAGNMIAAQKWFGEAAALHSTSFLTWYYTGNLALREGPAAPESAADSLRESIRLNPRFAPALVSLAQFDALHNEKLDEALQMDLRAVALEPSNIDYRLNAAEIRIARKEIPSAISALQATAKLARNDGDRARIQARLERVQAYADESRRVETLRAEASIAPPKNAPVPSTPVRNARGETVHPIKLISLAHPLPVGPPSGPHHTVTGTLKNVGCFEPKGLLLDVNHAGHPIALYTNDMYAISYTAGNFKPTEILNPCNQFEGMKAQVTYTGVDDPHVAGQIVSMELSR